MFMTKRHIIVAAWLTFALSILPEVIAVCRFAALDNQYPVSQWLARVIRHYAIFIPFTQWVLMATLFLGWQTWREFRRVAGPKLLLAAGLPVLLSLFVNLYEIRTWYYLVRYNLGPQERVDPATFLKPLGEVPIHTSEGVPQRADEAPKPSM